MASTSDGFLQLLRLRLRELGEDGAIPADRLSRYALKLVNSSSEGKLARPDTYPARLSNGEVFWVSFDLVREARGDAGIGVRRKELGKEEAAIAALIAPEPRVRVDDLLETHVLVRRADGSEELWLEGYESLQFGDGTTMGELVQKGLPQDPADDVFERFGYLKRIRAILRWPDFDDLPLEEQLALIRGAEPRVEAFRESLRALTEYLEHGRPDRDLRTALQKADRDVRAAVLKDVHGRTHLEIAKELRIPVPESHKNKNDSPTVRAMIKRGRHVLERAFGKEGWEQRVEALKAQMKRRERIDKELPQLSAKDKYMAVLARESGVSVEEARERVVAEGFDRTLDRWAEAVEQGEGDRAMSIQMSDWRFGLELYAWEDKEVEEKLRDIVRRWSEGRPLED
jgi:hypothetical protein